MTENNTWNQSQGQSSDQSGGRSPEYADDLTVQDTTTGALGERSSTGMSGGTTDTTTTGGVSNEPMRGGAASGAAMRDGETGSHRAMGDNTDGMGRDQSDRVTADETGTLIAADKVQGTAVYDAGGERLGTIDSLMLNKRSGKVAYAVMSFGGFLGIGERYHPLPWDKLTYDVDKGGYNIGATQDELRAGPTYSRDEIDDFDGDRGRGVDDYYGRQSALGGGITGATGVPIV